VPPRSIANLISRENNRVIALEMLYSEEIYLVSVIRGSYFCGLSSAVYVKPYIRVQTEENGSLFST